MTAMAQKLPRLQKLRATDMLERPAGCPVDPMVAGIAVFLLMYGLVMVGSASLEVAARTYGDPFHLVTRHTLYLFLSLLAAAASIAVPVRIWQKFDAVFLGAVFLLSFLSLGAQVLPWAGSRGLLPVRLKLRRMREDFSPLGRVLYFPTLLWLSDSDRMLRAIPALGAVAALVVIYGGPLSFWGFDRKRIAAEMGKILDAI